MIKLASPDIRDEDIGRVVEVLRSGYLIQGVNADRLEAELAEFSGIAGCALVSSGTAALHLALSALGIGPGDAVIVPAFTFPAPANAVINLGAEVVFCDVGRGTYVMPPELLEQTVLKNSSANLKAIIVVHEFGCPAEMEVIAEIAAKYELKLVEDAACALGTVTAGYHPGHYGDLACFSFHPRKAITCGEGGAVLGHDLALTEKVRSLRNHGITPCQAGLDFAAAGFNYRLTDFQAALALGQLTRFPAELSRRRQLAEFYCAALAGTPGLELPDNVSGHSWQSFMVLLAAGIERREVIRAMADLGVETNLGAQAVHMLPFYRERYGHTAADFVDAAELYRQGLVLPLYGKLQADDIAYVAGALKEVLHGI